MHDARRVGTFFSGLFLYIAAIAFAVMLADVHLPRDVHSMLGGRGSLAVLGIEALLMALLIFAVALVWSFVTLKRPRKSRRTAIAWFMSGIGAAWLGGLIYGVFHFALNPPSFQTMTNLLLASDSPPLWGLLNIIAVICAALLANLLALTLSPKPAHGSPATPVRAARPAATTSPA